MLRLIVSKVYLKSKFHNKITRDALETTEIEKREERKEKKGAKSREIQFEVNKKAIKWCFVFMRARCLGLM